MLLSAIREAGAFLFWVIVNFKIPLPRVGPSGIDFAVRGREKGATYALLLSVPVQTPISNYSCRRPASADDADSTSRPHYAVNGTGPCNEVLPDLATTPHCLPLRGLTLGRLDQLMPNRRQRALQAGVSPQHAAVMDMYLHSLTELRHTQVSQDSGSLQHAPDHP